MSSSHLDEFEVRAAAPEGADAEVDVEAGEAVENGVSNVGENGGENGAGSSLLGGAAAGGSYGAVGGDEVQPAAPKKKKEKSGVKAVSDALKTDMAAERTFFKWLWTGLHTGAIGTFIFVTFDNDKDDPYRVAVVGFAWGVAFLLVLYGLFAYNRRRAALRDGRIESLPAITREWGPCIVVIAVLMVVVVGLTYAVLSGSRPRKSHSETAFGAI